MGRHAQPPKDYVIFLSFILSTNSLWTDNVTRRETFSLHSIIILVQQGRECVPTHTLPCCVYSIFVAMRKGIRGIPFLIAFSLFFNRSIPFSSRSFYFSCNEKGFPLLRVFFQCHKEGFSSSLLCVFFRRHKEGFPFLVAHLLSTPTSYEKGISPCCLFSFGAMRKGTPSLLHIYPIWLAFQQQQSLLFRFLNLFHISKYGKKTVIIEGSYKTN